MALRRYSQFYSHSYSYENKYDRIRNAYAVLGAARKRYEIEKKENKIKSQKRKGKIVKY